MVMSFQHTLWVRLSFEIKLLNAEVNMKSRNLFLLLLSIIFGACFHEQEIPVHIEFDYSISEGSYTVPVELTITNKTTGADFYTWTFDGATPSSSDDKQPGMITYDQAGTYVIKLEAWNDTQRSVKEITIQLDSAVTLDFDTEILVNDFAPATVQIINNTFGASSYEWTFEGGIPATSTSANPPQIVFDAPGEHTIILRVSNGREFYTSSKTILVKEPLQPDFDIVPSFEDEDYEVPLRASLMNQSVSGIHYSWSSNGGDISNASSVDSEIYFDSPGEYTITLSVDNDKEVKNVQHTIVVKPNTNLYIMNDVKLGVNAAHTTIGSFYSPKLRSVLKRDEVNNENGGLIDLIFYGVNSSFSYCRFLSPDSAAKFTFPAIPNEGHTYFVNTLESTLITFTEAEFDAMTTDAPLTSIDIESNDTGTQYFTNSTTPRIVLFETSDGRKGAIKIKSFVSSGTQSYILMDVKVQKLNP